MMGAPSLGRPLFEVFYRIDAYRTKLSLPVREKFSAVKRYR